MMTLLANVTRIVGTGPPPTRDAALVIDGSRFAEVHRRPRRAEVFEAMVDTIRLSSL